MTEKKVESTKKTGGSGSVPKAPKLFSEVELLAALREMEGDFEGACIAFFLLDETAIQVKDEDKLDQLPEITIGVTVANWGDIQQRLFRTRMEYVEKPWKKTKYGFRFKCAGVPIKVKVIKRHRKFFSNLNTVFFDFATFNIPNQFEKYRKMRFMVR